LFSTRRDFSDRFDGDPEYLAAGKAYPGRVWDLILSPSAGLRSKMGRARWRRQNVMLEMANGSMAAHISEFPVGTTRKPIAMAPALTSS
jgi:hypothetical protein